MAVRSWDLPLEDRGLGLLEKAQVRGSFRVCSQAPCILPILPTVQKTWLNEVWVLHGQVSWPFSPLTYSKHSGEVFS